MPNFKCLRVKELALPFEKQGVCFKWLGANSAARLLYTTYEQNAFFLQISQNAQNEFIIKGEKHSKPEQIGILQKALLVFRDEFCEGIINEAFALKRTRLIAQNPYIQRDIHAINAKFKDFAGVFLEIGFGSGRHLLYQARENPQILMLGVEIYSPAIEQVAKLALKDGLNNVLLVKCDARLLLKVLENGALSKIFLHFPVPWGKQISRRVVSKDFAAQCARVLAKGGKFELRTDSAEYFEYSKEIFAALKNAKINFAKNENLGILSKYETRWKKQNKDIFDLWVSFDKFDENSQICGENLGICDENLAVLDKNLQIPSKNSNFFDENSQISNENSALNYENLSRENSKILNENSTPKNSAICNENLTIFNENLEFLNKNLNFSPQKLAKIQKNFCNQHFKGEDFFLRFENLYFIDKQNLLLKLSFGAFDKPEHSYLLLNKKSKFLFKPPFFTKENLKALNKFCEILSI